jgi:hypothetical protein
LTSFMLSASKVKAAPKDDFMISSDGTVWTEKQSPSPTSATVG